MRQRSLVWQLDFRRHRIAAVALICLYYITADPHTQVLMYLYGKLTQIHL